MNFKLSTKLLSGFLFMIILICFVGYFGLSGMNNTVREYNVIVETNIPVAAYVWELRSIQLEQTADVRGYVLYHDEKYPQMFADSNKTLTDIYSSVQSLLTTDKSRAYLADFKTTHDMYQEIAETVFSLEKQGNSQGALTTANEGRQYVDKNKTITSEWIQWVDQLNSGKVDGVKKDVASKQTQSYIVMILAALVGLGTGIYLARKITTPIKALQGLMAEASEGNLLVKAIAQTKDEIGQLCESFNKMIASQLEIVKGVKNSSVELSAASQEMAASSTEVSVATASVSENIQHVAQSMEDASNSSMETSQVLIELSALIQIAKDKAVSASINSESSINAAKEGKSTVDVVMKSMNTIHTKTWEAEKVITLLNEYSQQIGTINETITGIANQTNLLALNAAVEAARAGESGRGFAVVAEEVRKLAEQSNAEASNISQLISKITVNTDSAVVAMKHSLTEVEVGVEEVSKAGRSLENILFAVAETVRDIDGIAKVTDDEVASSDKIVQLIEVVAENIEGTSREAQEVSSAIEETAATIETVAASSEQTSAMAQNLFSLITRFKIDE